MVWLISTDRKKPDFFLNKVSDFGQEVKGPDPGWGWRVVPVRKTDPCFFGE